MGGVRIYMRPARWRGDGSMAVRVVGSVVGSGETSGHLVPRPPAGPRLSISAAVAPDDHVEAAHLRAAWRALASLPPRLMLCDSEGLPRHQRWFRVLKPNDGSACPTLTWGKHKDGGHQMNWKSCSSAPAKQRSVVGVSADGYPPFALGFEIRTDRGPPIKVNAPDSTAKAQWLAAFDALDEVRRLQTAANVQSLSATAIQCFDAEAEDLLGTRPTRAEVSAAFVGRLRPLDE